MHRATQAIAYLRPRSGLASVIARLFGAGIDRLDGRTEEALRGYQSIAMNPQVEEGLPVWAWFARRRAGELLGGSQGAALVEQADRLLRNGGVVDPERMVSIVAPC